MDLDPPRSRIHVIAQNMGHPSTSVSCLSQLHLSSPVMALQRGTAPHPAPPANYLKPTHPSSLPSLAPSLNYYIPRMLLNTSTTRSNPRAPHSTGP